MRYRSSALREAAADLGFGDGAASARLKILASLPPRTGTLANRVATRFHLDASPWYARQAPPAALRDIADAVWSDAQIRIEYESWKGPVRRTISPLGLVMKAGTWYVAGAVGATVRTYRVAAIRSLVRTGEPVRRPRHFDLLVLLDRRPRATSRRASETNPRGCGCLRSACSCCVT